MNQLAEAKELNRQAAEKIKEYELLEEARRRGFVEDIKFKALTDGGQRTLKGPLYIHHGNVRDYTGSIIYDERLKEWAEIIPEEEKKEEPKFKVGDKVEIIIDNQCGMPVGTVGTIINLASDYFYEKEKGCAYNVSNGEKTTCHSEIYLRLVPEKSLHDQIREGGWNKVWELAGNEFDFQTIHSRPLAAKMVENTVNYIKLLALSKVLNEGKEKSSNGFKYGVECIKGKLTWSRFENSDAPIFSYNQSDVEFSIEFAEKEWKIFYNAKQ